jgi:hypothetical protein
MTNPNAAKGGRFELAVTRFLAEVFGRQVRRPHQEGYKDVGDIHLSPFVLQAKDYSDVVTALRVAVPAAEVQAGHAEESYGVAVIKRRGKPVQDSYVAMTLETFRSLAHRLRDAEDEAGRNRWDAL